MARKRKADPEPDAVAAAPPEPAPAEATQPEPTPLQSRAFPALPAGIDADARVVDLTARDLLRLLAAFRA